MFLGSNQVPRVQPTQDLTWSLYSVHGPTDDVEKAVKLLKERAEAKQLCEVEVAIKAKSEHHNFLIGISLERI